MAGRIDGLLRRVLGQLRLVLVSAAGLLFAGRRLFGAVCGRFLRGAALLAGRRALALALVRVGDVTAAVRRFVARLWCCFFWFGFGVRFGEQKKTELDHWVTKATGIVRMVSTHACGIKSNHM